MLVLTPSENQHSLSIMKCYIIVLTLVLNLKNLHQLSWITFTARKFLVGTKKVKSLAPSIDNGIKILKQKFQVHKN